MTLRLVFPSLFKKTHEFNSPLNYEDISDIGTYRATDRFVEPVSDQQGFCVDCIEPAVVACCDCPIFSIFSCDRLHAKKSSL